jgi:hypothetical protein
VRRLIPGNPPPGDSPEAKSFGDVVEIIRASLGLSLLELGKRASVPADRVAAIALRNAEATARERRLIRGALACATVELFGARATGRARMDESHGAH